MTFGCKSLTVFLCAVGLAFGVAGCGEESNDDLCGQIQTAVSTCYPDLQGSAECSAEMMDMYAGFNFDDMTCDQIDAAGKADFWWESDDMTMNWPDDGRGDPSETDWDIVDLVRGLQRVADLDVDITNEIADWPKPELILDAREEMASWSHADLLHGAQAATWEQPADDLLKNRGVRNMVVEFTQGIVPVDLDRFVEVLHPADWGVELDHYLGGEVRVYTCDQGLVQNNRCVDGQPVRQLERMVLNQMPFDADALNLPCINGDMTKVEVVVYEEDSIVVYWRVMHSGNNTTESDIGSVAFERYVVGDESHTLVTFHSAHRLNTFGIHVPNMLLRTPVLGIGPFFEQHIDHYRELVTNVTCADGEDSDGDMLVDCDDADCDASNACSGWW